jgi:outer membrane receptor for ferric coprogen and ferric-rhodotorulic acid
MTTSYRRATGLPRRSLLAISLLAAGHVHAQTADSTASNAGAAGLEEILVVAQRARRVSTGATNLDLDIKETPQSISVVTHEQMELFGADSLNESLRLATGIQVEEWETNRTQFLARGFEIKNTQLDGIGLPNGWGIVTGALDTFGYEKLEVIRGANGLLTGVGNASGTINFVRKRPTNEAQGQVGLSFGSWDSQRFEADYSTPFTEEGTWAGRVVAALEDSDSYLRDFETDRTFFYGVIDGQVGENGTLAFGYSRQQADSTGNMWGALTFVASDGTQLEFDDSASTTQDWTYWDTTTEDAFVEYTHQLSANWRLKASYNHRRIENDDQLFFAYSLVGLDPETLEGLFGWAYKSEDKTTADLGDVTINGRFQLFGRDQEAMLGVSLAASERTDLYYPTDFSGPAFGPLPAFPYAGDVIPEPTWNERTFYSSLNQRLTRAFGVTRVSVTDRLKAIAGFNYAEYHRDGVGADGRPFDQTEDNLSPYAGLTFDFTDTVLGYANYSYIYQPQDQLDINSDYLDPTKGVNYEIGVKAEWLDRRLLTTLAWFNAKQEGLATYAGYNFETLNSYYVGVDIESEGFEFEATGKVNDYIDLLFGYTDLDMTGEDGDDTYTWVPDQTANLMVSARVPGYTPLSFGIGGRWQSEVHNADGYTGYLVREDSYTLLNAYAAWNVTPKVTLRANVDNLTDEKYINSMYYIGFYGAPRNYSLSLNWQFGQ